MKLGEQIEVTEDQYNALMNKLAGGVFFHRKSEGKIFVKCHIKKYIPFMKMIIDKN